MTNKEDYRIVTAPVLIPGVPDCDYQKGEQPLTPEEIKHLMTSFKKYQIIDYDHKYMFDGPWHLQRLGEPIDMWQTTQETTYIDRFDNERTTPPGTWYLKTKVTNPTAIKEIDEEKLNSYSLTTASRTLADKFQQIAKEKISAKNVTYTDKEVKELLNKHGLISSKHRTLLHEVPDPVGFTVSLTKFPCVGGSVFAKNCLTASQNIEEEISNKNGSDKMTENTQIENNRFTVDDFKNLFSFFTSMKSEETKEDPKKGKEGTKPEPTSEGEGDYVTREELDEAFTENNEKLINEISQLIDEKLQEKEENENGEGEEDPKKGKEGTKPGEQKEQPKTKPGENQVSTKSQSKQLDDPTPEEEDISYKKGTPEYQILKALGRDSLGNTKIKL